MHAAATAPTPNLWGRRVRIFGLKGRPELNGRCGVAGRFVAAKGRYAVTVEGEAEAVLLKPANLHDHALVQVTIDQHTPLSVVTEPFVDIWRGKRGGERQCEGTVEIHHGKKNGRGYREGTQRVNPHMTAWHHQLTNENVLTFSEQFYGD